MLEIYGPVVAYSAISFETMVPTIADMAARITAAGNSHAWLAAERNGAFAGYAYGTSHRARHAYRYSTEVSVYVHEAHRGVGVGAALYQRLFDVLAERGFFQAYAGITEPNDASSLLHSRAGFHHIGTFPRVGYKFGRWHDVAWWYRPLRDDLPEEAR